jgi:hypothetical protein
MTTQAIRLMTLGLFAKDAQGRAGAVADGSVDTLKGMGGRTLRCTSGNLWVTIEGDRKDYLLRSNETVALPTLGKVAITGTGSWNCQ